MLLLLCCYDCEFRGETRIFDLLCPDFLESCGYIQYLSGDGVLTISLMILPMKWHGGCTGLYELCTWNFLKFFSVVSTKRLWHDTQYCFVIR